MFQTGDRVVYGNSGICCIERIGVPDFETFERAKQYYFLHCEEDGSRIYAPVDTHVPMRAVMTAVEVQALLRQLPTLDAQPPLSRDHKLVVQHYQKLMQEHTAEALARTVKSIYSHRKGSVGRMTSAEEGILKKAEGQLCTEMAVALNISPANARDMLLGAMREK